MDTRLVETALCAFAAQYGQDAELLVDHYRLTRNVLTCLEPVGVRLGLMCGFDDEAVEVPDGVDRDCIVAIVKRDFSAATLAGIATVEMIRTHSGPWSDPKTHDEARRQMKSITAAPTEVHLPRSNRDEEHTKQITSKDSQE
jgi:hypothetical protein